MGVTINLKLINGCRLSKPMDIPETLRVVTDDETVSLAPSEGCFRVLNEQAGDDRIVWDRMDPEQIKDAAKLFDKLLQEGQTPYAVNIDSQVDMNRQLTSFDPHLEEIVFIPTQVLRGG